MNYKNLLCIGGPKDGQMIPISDGVPFIRVPMLQPPYSVALDYLSTPPDHDVFIEVVEYRRQRVTDFDGTFVEMLLASGVNDPIQRLIAGYKPKTDSAVEAQGEIVKDQQGNEIKLNRAYQFIFGGPGPDVTCVIVKSINEDGTVGVFDPTFNHTFSVKPNDLWRPLKFTWERWPTFKKAILEHGGSLDLSTD